MRKTKLFSIVLVTLLIVTSFATTAHALPGGSWASGIKIQNLNAVSPANLMLELYKPGSAAAAFTINKTTGGAALVAAANKSVEVYLPSYTDVTSGQYSVVVSSDVEIGVVVTTTNYSYGLADSYNSMTPAASVSVPYVYHNHNSWSTEIFVQNTSSTTTANVTVSLKEPATSTSSSDGVVNKDVPLTIEPGQTASVDTSQATHNNLNWFIGYATITSNVPVAVVANQIRLVGSGDAQGNVMISARGMTSTDAGTKVLLPSLYKNFSSGNGIWRSGIKIQNNNAPQTSVEVTFTADPDPANPGNPVWSGVKTVTINGNDNVELYLPGVTLDGGGSIPENFKGSAVLVSTSQAIIATVQHTNYGAANNYGVAMGYGGFASGSKGISLPSLYIWPSGAGYWYSGIKVQNFGTSPATFNVSITADPDVAAPNNVNGTISNVTLDPGKAIEFYLPAQVLDGGGKLPVGWKGSATIVGTGTDQLVATVIHTNYGRHVSNMYTGVPIP